MELDIDIKYEHVFCDWLDMTFPDDAVNVSDFSDWFVMRGFTLDDRASRNGSATLRNDSVGYDSGGVVKIDIRRTVLRLSVSGSSLNYLRSKKMFDDFLFMVSEFPHHITRIDVAKDVDVLGWKRIHDLNASYPETAALTSRSLKTKRFLSHGVDGRSTGTFYIGHRSKADVTARAYDKAHQIWETTGFSVGKNWFRYEIVVRSKRDRDCPSLRDVSEPTSLFYKYASPVFMRIPSDVGEWVPNSSYNFTPRVLDELLPAEKLKRCVSDSYYMSMVKRFAVEMGPSGIEYTLSLMRRELESAESVPVLTLADSSSSENSLAAPQLV